MKRRARTDKESVSVKVIEGIREIAEIVQTTLGPAGRPVIIDQGDGKVLVTKDGVTVAKAFDSTDPVKSLAARAAREACERTVRQAGDGTTTAIVLAHALVKEGQTFLEKNPGYSPQKLARELKTLFVEAVKPEVMALAKSLRGLAPEEARVAVRHVALVSANFDEEIADAVAEAVEYVGEDGMVVAEEGVGIDTKVVHQSGFPVNGGLSDLGGAASSAFVNRTAYNDCVVEGAYVVMYDGEITDIETIAPILQRIAGEVDDKGRALKSPVVVVAHSFGNHILKMMAQNFRKGLLSSVPFVTPRNGQSGGKQQFLYDLAAYVGGKVFDPQGAHLQEALPNQCGFVEKLKMGQSDTVFMSEPEVETIEARIVELKDQMDGASDFDKDCFRYRIGQLTGGVATVFAGGATSTEAKERHARVVDAVSAVRSAMEMGVIPGGGATLSFIAGSKMNTEGPAIILAKALQRPFVQILLNAGVPVDEYMNSQVGPNPHTDTFLVFDALKGEWVDWYKAGIMDPAKVTLCALENALSVAQLLMTLGGVITCEVSEGEDSVRAMQEAIVKQMNGDLD